VFEGDYVLSVGTRGPPAGAGLDEYGSELEGGGYYVGEGVRYLIGRVGGLGLDHDADEGFRPHAPRQESG
jgi:hypothetical protein